MTRICRFRDLPSTTVSDRFHSERSLAKSEASRQTESKDSMIAGATRGREENFHIVTRFFDEQGSEMFPVSNCDSRRLDLK